MENYLFNWTAVCGSPDFHLWNWEFHNFGLCFQKLILEILSHFFLAIASAYYLGKQSPWVIRNKPQKAIVYVRACAVLICLVTAILEPWLSLEWAGRKLYWVDIASSFAQIFGWTIHLVYLYALKHRITRGTRGPRPVILAWTITFIFNVCYARAAWSDVFENLPNKDTFLIMFRILTGIQLGSQVLYLCTLFPKGLIVRTRFRDVLTPSDEQTPLMGARHRNYTSLQQSVDPYHLGVGEDQVNLLSYLTFCWVNPLMEKGKQRRLHSVDDLYRLPPHLQSESVSSDVQKEIMLGQPLLESSETEFPVQKENFYLFKALHKCFGKRFYQIGLLKFCGDAIGFVGPMLLHELVVFVQGKEPNAWKGYLAGIGLILANVLGILFVTHYNWSLEKLNLQIRASLVTSIFRKIQHVNSAHLSKMTQGEIINLMSTDTDRVVKFCESFHAFWSMPLQVGITLFLLYSQIGITFLVGVAITILVLPINRVLAVQIAKYSKQMMFFKDKRVSLMTEVLAMIKAVKLNTLESVFRRKIMEERTGEVAGLSARKYLDAGCVYLWAVTPVLVPLATFGTYVALGNPMDPARIFTAVALFNILITPLNAFPWVVNGLVESWVSIQRVEKLMMLDESDPSDYYTVVAEMSTPENDLHLLIEKGAFSWNAPPTVTALDESNSLDLETTTTINDISVQIDKGQVVGVVGVVGSGKTTLIHAIIGEIEKKRGIVAVSCLHEGFAIALQNPWLQNATIKDNILFGQNFDDSRYRSVLYACCLEDDLRGFALQDETRCGENGSSLSGGQRARVALARAVYQNKSVYLLDDILSAVDENVAEHILQHCIHGFLKNKTVLMITQNLRLLTRVDLILRMEAGHIIQKGVPQDVLPQITTEDIFANDWLTRSSKSSGAVPRKKKSKKSIVCPNREFTLRVNEEYMSNLEREESETRSFGDINGDVFLSYFSPIGSVLCLAIVLSMFFMQSFRNLTDVWLAKWVSNSKPHVNGSLFTATHWSSYIGVNPLETLPNALYRGSNYATMGPVWNNYYKVGSGHLGAGDDPITKYYLTIYIILASTNFVFALFRSFLFAYAGIRSAKDLHRKLLDSVLYAKMTFFDLNPLGRILNRFSNDVYSIDDLLPFQMNIFFAQLIGLAGSILITLYGVPWILLVYIPLVFLYYTIQQFYRHASRDIRRIYALTLSPLCTHFTETIHGLPVIKAMRAGHRFAVLNEAYLEQNQRAQFSLKVISQWLNMRLQFIGVGVLIGVTVLTLFQNTKAGISPGLVGLVISYALTMNGFLNGVVMFLTETERELISVERVHQYVTQTPRERESPGNPRSPMPPLALPYGWPTRGTVTFDNVYFRYHDHNPFALRGVSFEAKAGEKIGIMGRTGAGKSSILMALFRIAETTQGRIAIDNVDITDVSLRKLRSALSIVSQDILLFSGTIRENLDPPNENTDVEIWAAVEQCSLEALVEGVGGLDATMSRAGNGFSAGQRQLFCLARALLCRTKIVCIDEGTSLLDNDTDLLVQKAIRDSFRDKTLIVIAHRTHTLINCDRIIVMENGEVKEITDGINATTYQ